MIVEKRTIWMSEEDQIVSFHPVEGYQQINFCYQDLYIDYIFSLTQRGFRFQ